MRPVSRERSIRLWLQGVLMFQSASMRPVSREAPPVFYPPQNGSFNPRPCGQSPESGQREQPVSMGFQSASMRPVSRELRLQSPTARSRFNPRPCGQSPERWVRSDSGSQEVSIRVHAASLPRDLKSSTACLRRSEFQSASMRPVSRETHEVQDQRLLNKFQSASMRPVSRESSLKT